MPQPVVLAEAAAVALFAASSLSAVAADAGQGKARFWIVSSRLMEVFLEYDIANRFHYKSIETWLDGICKSHCTAHKWSSANLQWAPGKNSIFSLEEGYDEADFDAPMLDLEDHGEESK